MVNNIETKILGGLVGFAIGDALGVPIEFTPRKKDNPLTEMVGFGSHSVPAGTWSDDTSMTIAAMDSICENRSIDYDDIMNRFCKWAKDAKYTATGVVFDIGIGTRNALNSYYNGRTQAIFSGGKDERNNGNGSLMRMLPIVFYLYYNNISEKDAVDTINMYSSLTHGHDISKLGCNIYYDFMKSLLDGKSIEESYYSLSNKDYTKYFDKSIVEKYDRILNGNLVNCSIDDISSSGYVVSTLEASIWSLLKSNSYEEAVVKAINLGDDTDTVGAITGSMAGVFYGRDSIPKRWYKKLAKKEYLEFLAKDFLNTILSRNISGRMSDDMGINHNQELYRIFTSSKALDVEKDNNKK